MGDLSHISKRIRCHILNSVWCAQSGHIGPSFSIVEILVVLFFKAVRVNSLEDRDRFILSKGHASPALYAVLAEKGFVKIEDLKTLRSCGSPLEGHPVCNSLPFIDASTGSLGQGLSVAIGRALALKLKQDPAYIYVVLGDGESQEGQVWEAAMSAAKYKLAKLIVFIDHNKLQNEWRVDEAMPLGDFEAKWNSFGWHVQTIDGHDLDQIADAIVQAKENASPSVIISDTIKGKGVSFMENSMKWHSSALDEGSYTRALEEIER